jgi:hypothetical protein
MITADMVREALSYDLDSGVFRWAKRINKKTVPGRVAGYRPDGGYAQIRIAGKLYKAHRLAWLWMTGEWPSGEVDHKDRDRSNNRWLNLRLASPSENKCNIGKLSNNSTGYKGVCFQPRATHRPYTAEIRFKGVRRYLGSFRTAEEAHAAYRRAAEQQHGEFARFS